MTTERTYPRKIFYLTPALNILETVVVEKYGSYGSTFDGDISTAGKYFFVGEMFASWDDALTAAMAKLAEMEERHRKMGKSIFKKSEMVKKLKAQQAEKRTP